MKILKLLLLFIFVLGNAQNDGFKFQEDVKKEVIPFKLINNLIFIPITVNGVELTFLLDTGVAETLLFSLENKEINFYDVEKMKFSGLGGNLEIEGLKSIKNIVQAGKNLKDYDHAIFIILNEDFNISSHVGIPVNGIIGYHFFKNHAIKIDYTNKKITVFAKSQQRETRKYTEIPITVEYKKPYLIAGVQQTNEKKDSKLLIDLGNSDALWLFPSLIPDFKYNRPNIEDFLGRGFNGEVYGKRSRIHKLFIEKYLFEKPLMAMPDEFSIQHIKLAKDRKGSVGADILRRFTIIFNYPENKIFLKKNRNFDDPFHFNMSGLDMKHDGMFWDKDLVTVRTPKTPYGDSPELNNSTTVSNTVQYKFVLKPEYSVSGVRLNSPAMLCGLQKGDKILQINGKRTADMTLDYIYNLLKSEEGKHINIAAERNGVPMKFSFILEDPIPYTEEQ